MGSGARAFVRQGAAVDAAEPSIGPRHAEDVPNARGRQVCAQVPTAADRAEGLVLAIMFWIFPRFVNAATLAHKFVLGELRRGRGYRGGGLWDPDHPIKRSDQTQATFMFKCAGRESFAEALHCDTASTCRGEIDPPIKYKIKPIQKLHLFNFFCQHPLPPHRLVPYHTV